MSEADEKDYYEPILVKSAFKGNYKKYESRDRNKNLSVKQHLYMIISYLRDLINDYKATTKSKNNKNQWVEWKIQLCMNINSISSKDTGETHTLYVWSDNERIMWGNKADDIIKELFKSFLHNYQKEEQIMRVGSNFIFESVEPLEYHLHKISLKREKSPEWLKNKKATINPQNKHDNNCFQYAITAALNHENIGINLERISNIKPFMNQYNWKGIDFLHTEKNDEKLEKSNMEIDWKEFEQNNKTIALNILFAPHNTKTTMFAYKSKYNHKHEK